MPPMNDKISLVPNQCTDIGILLQSHLTLPTHQPALIDEHIYGTTTDNTDVDVYDSPSVISDFQTFL